MIGIILLILITSYIGWCCSTRNTPMFIHFVPILGPLLIIIIDGTYEFEESWNRHQKYREMFIYFLPIMCTGLLWCI